MKRGGALKRRTPPRAKRPLAKVSARGVSEKARYASVRLSVLRRDGYRCQAHGIAPGPCWGSVVVHHVWPVGTGGPRFDRSNLQTTCRSHHSWIHDTPREARRLGLLRSALKGA